MIARFCRKAKLGAGEMDSGSFDVDDSVLAFLVAFRTSRPGDMSLSIANLVSIQK